MPQLEELVRDYQHLKAQRNRGLFSLALGAGILSLVSPTLYDHWENQWDAATIALDSFVVLPALAAVLGGGFYAARAMYRATKLSQHYPTRE